MWPVMLTAAQSARLIEALRQYRADLPPERVELSWGLGVVLSMSDRGLSWDHEQAVLVKAALDAHFASMPDDSFDELLEQAYYKLYGGWPVHPPWFTKKLGIPAPD